jgi:hypothetical protein
MGLLDRLRRTNADQAPAPAISQLTDTGAEDGDLLRAHAAGARAPVSDTAFPAVDF